MLELRQTISGSILERLAPLKWTFAVVIFVVVLAGEKKKAGSQDSLSSQQLWLVSLLSPPSVYRTSIPCRG